MTLKVGDKVVTVATVKPKRFANREGVVELLERRGKRGREIGINIGSGVAWFYAHEVVAVSTAHNPQD